MSVAIPIPLLQNLPDVNVSLGVGVDENMLVYDHDTARFVLRAPFDGTPYALLAGRAGGQTLYGGTAANDDITIHGTSDGTRTTSYVLLQPTAGNVGIGTSAPGAKLEINNGAVAGETARLTTSATYGWMNWFEGAVRRGTIGFGDAGQLLNNAIADSFAVSGLAALHLGANDDALKGITITTAGNVGIGTTAPVSPLHITSTTATTNALRDILTIGTDVTGVGAGDVNLGPGILFQAESSTTAAQDQARILSYWSTATHATMASKLAFQTRTAGAALATAMTIDGAGNVGIGVTNSGYKLEIRGGVSALNVTTTDWVPLSAGTGLQIVTGASTGNTYAQLQNYIAGALAYGNIAINPLGGNVGINDTAPAEALDVTGNINTTGVVKVDDVQVLSNRVIDARCADVANSGDATTDGLIDALRDAMVAHGLIAAA